jgi:DNA mismatch repair protein MutS2
MQPAALRTLEFDRIRDALAREALTPLGRARAHALEPAGDPVEVQARLDLSAEAAAYVAAAGSLAISAPDELTGTLSALEIEDQLIEPLALLGLARFADSVDDVAAGVARAGAPPNLSGLRAIAARAASFAEETGAIRRAVDPSGDVNDRASPALKDLRDKLRRLRAKLRSTLEGLTRGRDTAKYLQDQIVTDRNGRYVLVVRAEHREAIPGIVHGSSASGASLYLEPLSTVELNNDIVGLSEREKAEVRRILLALANAFRRRPDDVAATVEAAADFDELGAKAQLARRLDGIAPELTSDGGLEFLGARHPLLILKGTEVAFAKQAPSPSVSGAEETGAVGRGQTRLAPSGVRPRSDAPVFSAPAVVPSDLRVMPPTRALVISGPNTGGKTVALKAVGLLALMAQSGLLIPVERGSRFTPFRSVFADIGDDQSISASLSTFSARIANIVSMERALELPALVLLDEVGGGTDPVEGGALGTAVIDHFRQRGASVIATTHDDALKSYAATTEGVATAAFGFDPETYAPSYRLIYGAPGRSLALEIAERLGMPASVIVAARARRTGRESQLAEHLARVDKEIAALDHEKKLAERDRKTLAAERQHVLEREARLAEREAVVKTRLDDRLNEKLREARAEVDRIVGQLKMKADALSTRAEHGGLSRGPVLSTGEVGGLRADARAALGAVAQSHDRDAAARGDDGVLDHVPAVGETVFLAAFGADAVVKDVSGNRVDVEVRGKRMRVKLGDLRKSPAAGSAADRPSRSVRLEGAAPGPGLPVATRELMLIGTTVEDAIGRAEKFLDRAILADERRLRVVHGHGTGRLRDALRTFLRAHPLVASATPAPENEGGQGATIVELKE